MSESPSGPSGSVKVVDFTLFGQRFQAISAGPRHEFNDAVSMVVLCDDQPIGTETRSWREVASRRRAGGSSTGSVFGGKLSPPSWTR
jgi:predicted 3-demethylubiquinone-9 3-methyltransferase (glyoxalase superfamily)